MSSQTNQTAPQDHVILLAIILFISYLCVAIALPVVSLYVAGPLHLSNAWAGLGVGIAFLSTILTRGYAGGISDRRGAKSATWRGLCFYIGGALVSGLSGQLVLHPVPAFVVLMLGRLLLGLGESLTLVGIIAWGIGMVGPARAGRVLALAGAGMYGALAVGSPIGITLFNHFGFTGTMLISALLSLVGLVAICPIQAVKPADAGARRDSFLRVVGNIWAHGLIICLQGIGFAAIGAFFALHFRTEGWAHAGLGLTAFGVGFVLVRLLFGHLPDRMNGVTLAIISLCVEAVGQALIWQATTPTPALAGAFLTGLGCSLIYPAMGREVVNLVAPNLRGTALGAFSAFQDLAYGLTGPLVGLLADHAGYSSIFLVGFLAAVLGILTGLWARQRSPRRQA